MKKTRIKGKDLARIIKENKKNHYSGQKAAVAARNAESRFRSSVESMVMYGDAKSNKDFEKLNSKESGGGGSMKNSKQKASGKWVTVRGRALFIPNKAVSKGKK